MLLCSRADHLFEYGPNLFEELERVHSSTLCVPVFEAPAPCGTLVLTDGRYVAEGEEQSFSKCITCRKETLAEDTYSELGIWYRGLLAPVSSMTSRKQLVVCAEA